MAFLNKKNKEMKDTIKSVLLFSNLPKDKYDEIVRRIDSDGVDSLTKEERKMIQKRFDLLRKIMNMSTYEIF